jgi:hypothetical protein
MRVAKFAQTHRIAFARASATELCLFGVLRVAAEVDPDKRLVTDHPSVMAGADRRKIARRARSCDGDRGTDRFLAGRRRQFEPDPRWLIGVPAGAALALGALRFRKRLEGTRGWRARLGHGLAALDLILGMLRSPASRGWLSSASRRTGPATSFPFGLQCMRSRLSRLRPRSYLSATPADTPSRGARFLGRSKECRSAPPLRPRLGRHRTPAGARCRRRLSDSQSLATHDPGARRNPTLGTTRATAVIAAR